MTHERAKQAILQVLQQRDTGKSICPSEAARELAGAGKDWRAQLPLIHEAVDAMLDERMIELSWKGKMMNRRRGAYRITRRQSETPNR